jgi:3-dehydroquinate dehydratase/shikimate dehydrogenase
MNSTSSIAPPRMLRHRLPRVCVPVVGKNAAEMVEKAEQVARDIPFIEFRLDYLSTPSLFLPKLKSFIEYHPHVTLIATCRRAKAGGKFKGSIAAEIDILAKAAALGCHLVDVELETASHLKPADWNKLKKNAQVILSFHDFRGTKKLDETFAKMEDYPVDFLKMVTTATSLHDNVVMMKFLEKRGDQRPMIGVSMGEQGIISRALAVRAGSIFTFGAANPGEETAPGQIAARTLIDTYRIEQVDAATRVYGVVGDPIAHSLSPAMMNAAFRRENLNAVYLALHAKTIGDLMQCVRDIPIHGLSVTMPYKTEILKYLDKTDPVTQKIGACNTVIRGGDAKLYGFNTDVAGVIRPLEQRLAITGSKFLVLGAGGAARAAVFGLKERGAEVYILNRTAAAAQKLAKQAKAKAIQKSQLAKLTFDAIINATPVGMKGEQDKPMISEKEMNTRYAFEMVYSPTETKFTKMARAKGIHVIPGIEMFVHQGARQFEIWTGKPAPFDEMQRVVQHALDLRALAAKK